MNTLDSPPSRPCSTIHYTIRPPSTNHATEPRPAINSLILEAPPSRRSRGSLASRVSYTSLYDPQGCVCALSATAPAICPLSCGFARCRGVRFICEVRHPPARRWFRCRCPPFMCTNIVMAYANDVIIPQCGTGRRISTLRPSPGGSRRFSPSRDIIYCIVVCGVCLSLRSGYVPNIAARSTLSTVLPSLRGVSSAVPRFDPPRQPYRCISRLSVAIRRS